jgi:DNA modification methylase
MDKPNDGVEVKTYVEKIDKLIANELNPRTINRKAYESLKKSLKDFPEMKQLREIVVDENLTILGGHQRIHALKELGYSDVTVKQVFGLTEKQKREFIIKDNTASGEWDTDIIANQWDVEELENWGVPKFELGLIEPGPEAKEDDFDTTPPEEPITVLGDLYEIGEHRLLCGDSTCSDTVGKLMNGEKADMVFTDPPYGVDFVGIKGTMYQNGKKKGKDSYEAIKNDDLKNESLTDLFYESISNAIINTKSNSAFYIFFGINKSKETIEAISNLDLEIRNWLIWDKGNVGFHAMGAQYKPNYESFLYCFKEGNPPEWVGNQQQQTIWRHSVERLGLHPTMKPITLISQAIENHNISLLLDLFLGSGSTMVASHQLKP